MDAGPGFPFRHAVEPLTVPAVRLQTGPGGIHPSCAQDRAAVRNVAAEAPSASSMDLDMTAMSRHCRIVLNIV